MQLVKPGVPAALQHAEAPPKIVFDKLAPTIFHQGWWLDAVTGGNYACAEVWEGGRKIGFFPYVLDRIGAGQRLCGMPVLTHFLGPAIDDGKGASCNRVLKRAQITRDLLQQVPKVSGFWQKLHRNTQDTLVYQDLGYETSVQFTFEVAPRPEAQLWQAMRDKTRNVIRRAQERHVVLTIADPAQFAALYQQNLETRGRRSHYGPDLIMRACTAAIAQGQGRIIAAHALNGGLAAAIFYVWDAQAAYYLLSTRVPGSSNGAVSLLVWEAMKDIAGKGLIFDFEGVVSTGSALFFTGFGGEVTPRYIVQRANLAHKIAGRLSNPFQRKSAEKFL